MDGLNAVPEYQLVCPSITPVGLALGPDNPGRINLSPGTLSQSALRILTADSLTHACILTPA